MTQLIHNIQQKVAQNAFEFSEHALTQSILRDISVQEVREALTTGEMIEDYPDDKYGPSLLILGFTGQQRPLHLQCTYPSWPIVKFITLYEPDPNKWITQLYWPIK